jgi:hypothetical protein
MLGLDMLDVAIGIVFIYLLISLICSAINELIEAFLKKRAKDLERGIRELLNDHPGSLEPGQENSNVASLLYKHPLVMSLFKGSYKSERSNLPSYIPARNFALALMDLTTSGKLSAPANAANANAATGSQGEPAVLSIESLKATIATISDPKVKQALNVMVQMAGNDINKVQENIEEWYNSSMDRVSGWYKRRVQTITLVVGFLLTAGINADTIAIFKSLSADPALRSAMVTSVQKYNEKGIRPGSTETPEAVLRKSMDELQQLTLPIGWAAENPLSVPTNGWDWLVKVLGWIITAMAISLGAPFWFDVLNKFMVVRATVKPTEKSPDEASEDRQRKK